MCAKKPPFGRRRSEMPRRRRGWFGVWGSFLSRKRGIAPPISFSPCWRKRNAPRPVQRKRGAGSRLGGSRFSSLAAQVVRTLCGVCPLVTLAFLLTALRAGAGGKVSCKDDTALRHRPRSALMQRLGCVRYSACFFAVRRLFQCAKMYCGKLVLWYFSFRCC